MYSVFISYFLAAQNFEGKRICKYYVQKGLGLATDDHVADMTLRVPLVVCITRLVAQKGLHLIIKALKHVEELVSVSIHYLISAHKSLLVLILLF